MYVLQVVTYFFCDKPRAYSVLMIAPLRNRIASSTIQQKVRIQDAIKSIAL
jgi:hypothetical protein